MKNKLIALSMFFSLIMNSIYSQVGVNTEYPQADLDVNGNIRIRKDLKVGNSKNIEEAVGTEGQVLVSQGPGLPPVWKDLEISEGIVGEYKLTNTYFKEDRVGLELLTEYTHAITPDAKLDGTWAEIPGLHVKIAATKINNRVLITLQTVIQSDYFDTLTKEGEWAEIVCGIFLNNQLKSFRYGRVVNAHAPLIPLTMIYAFDNIAIGDSDLKIAFQRRKSSASLTPYPLHAGQGASVVPPVSNSFMNKSIIRVDVFE